MRTLAVASLVAATLAIPAVASAGTYVSLGIGNTSVSDSSPTNAFGQNGRSGRLAVGWRFLPVSFGTFSVEGGYEGWNAIHGTSPYDGQTFFAAGKFNLPLSQGFEAYARLGVQHSTLSSQTTQPDFPGSGGWLAGLGFEYRLSGIQGVPPVLSSSSIWVDYHRDDFSITNTENKSRGMDVDLLTIGVSVGF